MSNIPWNDWPSEESSIAAATNPWAKISDIAKRVGVKPHDGGPATILATGADGASYDVFDVVIAVLDRLDK